MRRFFLGLIFLCVSACDPSRVYEANYDFPERYWAKEIQPAFKFNITHEGKHNLYFNVRNESSFKNANIYFTYYLSDTTGQVLETKLTSEYLFDGKTGEPFGRTVLGDIFDHQLLISNIDFENTGTYIMKYEQFTREDSLSGILSVGLRVERAD